MAFTPPTITPFLAFNNQTSDGVSLTFSPGSNANQLRYLVISVGGALDTAASIRLEKYFTPLADYIGTGDAILGSSYTFGLTKGSVQIQIVTAGTYRLRLQNTAGGTNINAEITFSDDINE
jgi:hypothetical protein